MGVVFRSLGAHIHFWDFIGDIYPFKILIFLCDPHAASTASTSVFIMVCTAVGVREPSFQLPVRFGATGISFPTVGFPHLDLTRIP